MKNIIITGGGTGLGSELAKKYAEAGNHIILLGRREATLKRTSEEIFKIGGSSEGVVCDITKYSDIDRVIDNLINKHKKIDMLINNAGVGYFGPLEHMEETEINITIDTNIKGTIYITQRILKHLKEMGEGKIINIISTAGLRGKVNESVYVASKFAVRGFTESLQKELEREAIKITAVYMGGMNTPFWDKTDHVKDKSRLKSPGFVADIIFKQDDGRKEIFVDR